MEMEEGSNQPNINLPEILEKVLSKLRRRDLLHFRLVCHLWNKESVYHLRKSGTLKLSSSSALQKYREFVQTTDADFLMPIELVLGYRDDMSIVEFNINSLVDMHGGSCVADLQIWNCYAFKDLGLCSYMRILNKISKGLRNLGTQNCCGEECDEILLLDMDDLCFPNLKSIWREDYGDIEESDHSLIKFVIDHSPNFEHLTTTEFRSNEIPFDRVKTLDLLYPQSLLDLQIELRAFPSRPTVEHFIYVFVGGGASEEHSIALTEILNAFASTLKSIDLGFLELCDFDLSFPSTLPELKYVRIQQIRWFGESWCLNPDTYNFTPEHMPALSKVKLSVGIHLAEGESMLHTKKFLLVTELILEIMDWLFHFNEEDGDLLAEDEEPIIPGEQPGFLYENINHLLNTFPNAVKIGIESPHEMMKRGRHVKKVIRVIVESRASAIEELSIDDYQEDYLGQVLSEMDQNPTIKLENIPVQIANDIKKILGAASDDPNIRDQVTYSEDGIPKNVISVKTLRQSIRMTRLRKLKLTVDNFDAKVLSLGTKLQHKNWSWPMNTFRLISLGTYCPKLRVLEISAAILSSKGYEASWSKARIIEKRFRNGNVKVDLI